MSIVVCCVLFLVFFFFKQKTAYEMRISDWSSDVCSSDLGAREVFPALSASQDSARAPPPPYGWSPSPCRGGPATIGRQRIFPCSVRVERSRDTHRLSAGPDGHLD